MTKNTTEGAAPATTRATPKAASKSQTETLKSKPKAKPAASAAAPAVAPAVADPMTGITETLEEVAAFQKENVEAFMAASKFWTSGMGAFTGAAFEIGKKNYERALNANKEILACDSFQDAFEIRAQLAREFADTSMADATMLSELATKAVKEAVEPLQERYNLALDGLWKAA